MTERKEVNQLFYNFCDQIGVMPTYQDQAGHIQQISRDTLFAIAKALGVPIENENDIKKYLSIANSIEEKLLDEISICWQGCEFNIPLQVITKTSFENNIYVQIQLENKEIICDIVSPAQLIFNNGRYFLPLRKSIPLGYHHVQVEVSKKTASTLLIVAPQAPVIDYEKCYGFFTSIYALHSKKTKHGGDLTDFNGFIKWAAKCGASFIGTLPFNAVFSEGKYLPNPYAPISRLFWNEIYLDITQLPEFSGKHYDKEMNGFTINHQQMQRMFRDELSSMAKICRNSQRANILEEYIALHPELKSYAKFRAIYDYQKQPWQTWQDDYFQPEVYHYHLYAQWSFETQLQAMKENAQRHHLLLYTDLPVSVRKDGYDAYQYKAQFVEHMSIGTPPNSHFKTGRNWEIPPLNPLSMAKHQFSYFIKILRTIMPAVDILDVDNIRELQQVFWIPDGMAAKEGAYVKYPHSIFHAILLLEAHRHQVILTSKTRTNFPAMTTLSTHDAPPFAAFLQGKDLKMRVRHRLLTRREAAAEKTTRLQQLQIFIQYSKQLNHINNDTLFADRNSQSTSTELDLLFQLLLTALTLLAKSNDPFLLINIEDLWLETKQQNLATMTKDNFKNKLAYSIEMLDNIPNLSIILALLNQLRPSNLEFGSQLSKKLTT